MLLFWPKENVLDYEDWKSSIKIKENNSIRNQGAKKCYLFKAQFGFE